MGRHNSIDSLPKETRRWLEWALVENNFIGYAELESLLKGKGYSIIRSSLQQFSYKMEQQLARVWAIIEVARLLAREAGNNPDNRSAGLITLVQTEMTDILMRLRKSWGNGDLSARAKLPTTASKNIAALTRASINLKRYQVEIRKRVERVAVTIEKIARKGGLPAEAVQALCRGILGVVS